MLRIFSMCLRIFAFLSSKTFQKIIIDMFLQIIKYAFRHKIAKEPVSPVSIALSKMCFKLHEIIKLFDFFMQSLFLQTISCAFCCFDTEITCYDQSIFHQSSEKYKGAFAVTIWIFAFSRNKTVLAIDLVRLAFWFINFLSIDKKLRRVNFPKDFSSIASRSYELYAHLLEISDFERNKLFPKETLFTKSCHLWQHPQKEKDTMYHPVPPVLFQKSFVLHLGTKLRPRSQNMTHWRKSYLFNFNTEKSIVNVPNLLFIPPNLRGFLRGMNLDFAFCWVLFLTSTGTSFFNFSREPQLFRAKMASDKKSLESCVSRLNFHSLIHSSDDLSHLYFSLLALQFSQQSS